MTNEQRDELERLRTKQKEILAKCSGWMRCQDGSYEMALYHSGYDSVSDKIAKLEKEIA